MAGTALLGLAALAAHGISSGCTASDVSSAALTVLGADQADERCRIAGLQICARLGARKAVAAAAQIASTPGGIPVRCSAIAALGELGGEPELALLNSLARETDPALEVAVSQAVHHLTNRIGSSRL
jgi:hypothetical protein